MAHKPERPRRDLPQRFLTIKGRRVLGKGTVNEEARLGDVIRSKAWQRSQSV